RDVGRVSGGLDGAANDRRRRCPGGRRVLAGPTGSTRTATGTTGTAGPAGTGTVRSPGDLAVATRSGATGRPGVGHRVPRCVDEGIGYAVAIGVDGRHAGAVTQDVQVDHAVTVGVGLRHDVDGRLLTVGAVRP